MASSLQIIIFISCLLFQLSTSAVSPLLQQQLGQKEANGSAAKEDQQEEKWSPATEPRTFSYKVDDRVKGASQLRNESWNNGTATGMYTLHMGNDQYQIINYIADANGFRITSTQTVSGDELMGGHPGEADTVKVDSNVDGLQSNYKLKGSDIQHQGSLPVQQPQRPSSFGRKLDDAKDHEAPLSNATDKQPNVNANATSSNSDKQQQESQSKSS
jgi:hypothetical protein